MAEMPPQDLTLGEVWRRIDRFETWAKDEFAEVKTLILANRGVDIAVYTAERDADRQRFDTLAAEVKDLRDAGAANRRLIWTSLIAPIVTAFVVALITAQLTVAP